MVGVAMFDAGRYRGPMAIAASLWLFAICADGKIQQIRRTIRARISMPDGSVARNIKVKLEDNLGALIRDGFSDTEGNFEVNNLGTGSFLLTVPSDGNTYETAMERVEINRDSTDVTPLSI